MEQKARRPKHISGRPLQILVVMVMFVAIGVVAIIITHAATSATGGEPESGSLSGPASVFSDASASGGKAVRFGSGSGLPLVTPIWSDSFNQSMGVNTHFKDSSGDSAIYADKTAVANKVLGLDVRAVREKFADNSGQNTGRSLLASSNVKWHVTMAAIGDYATIMSSNSLLDSEFAKIATQPQLYVSVGGVNEPNTPAKFSVNSKAISNGVATLTTAAGNSLEKGEIVTITGVGSGFDGTRTLTGVSGGTITFSTTGGNQGSSGSSGTINGHTYGDWQAKAAAIQQKIWERKAAVSATLSGATKAAFDNIKVVGPSLMDTVPYLQTDYDALGATNIYQYADYGDIHYYPSGLPPSSGIAQRVSWNQSVYHSKKTYVTETGFNNGTSLCSYGMPIPENISGVYAPKDYLDLWNIGVVRTFTYELLDSPSGSTTNPWEEHFGLVGTPSATTSTWYNKLAYNNIARLGSQTADPGSNYTPPAIPLSVSIAGNNPEVKDIVMGKRDGSSYLALWRDVQIFNPIKCPAAGSPGSNINVGTVNVTITTSNGSLTVPVDGNYKWLQLYPTLKLVSQ